MASSSSSSSKDYQVFLSFRGEDTRKTFLSHLYGALTGYGIRTFKDDRDLSRGGSISDELLRAIERSQIAIVVMSQNYASSSWCLEELVKIMECRKTRGLHVIPVFYNIDPSDVRKQKRSFEDAFLRHKNRFEEEKLQEWKEILAEVGTISGWHWRNWDGEFEFINNIVRDVLDRLFPMSSHDTKYLIGMDAHMKKLEHLLRMESKDVRMMGLWGMGGIGKTTIARWLYDRVRRHFEHCNFMESVKEMFKNCGTSALRERFLSEIFRDRNLKLWDAGSNVIKERLCGKTVLIVLDDVDKMSQLEFFAGESEWFGPGSRIIITTRDKKLLEDHKVRDVYEVTLLDETDALQLFSKYAFKESSPEEDFHELSIEVIRYAGGLPLALTVLGSLLLNRDKSMWLDTLEKLSETSVKGISDVLRVSYDGLDSNEQNIFLYIASLLKGMCQSKVGSILKACGFKPDLGIKILIEKSLITCDEKLYIQVHDLLQDMARDIIRQDFPSEPWKHKIVWNPKDISKLFKMSDKCNEMIKVEAMLIDMSKLKVLRLSPMAFRGMHDLIFLKICNNYLAWKGKVQLLGGLDYLPEELAYLFWENFPLKTLPSSFHPEYLVELYLGRNDSLEKLWDGTQPLMNLRVMDLSRCSKLIEIPDLSQATRLERLNLTFCESLIEVASSVGTLQNLYDLSLSHCKNLTKLPSGINLKSLDQLSLNCCSRLSEFPCISKNVRSIFLHETAIEQLPPSIRHLSRLEHLQMSGCTRLKYISSEIQNVDSLNCLDLSNCSSLNEFPEVGKNIETLILNATAIEEVPPSINHLSQLQRLYMSDCKRLKNLPKEIQNLDSLPHTLTLDLSYCPHFNKFPEVGKNIKELNLEATAIEEVPPSIQHSHVRSLRLSHCKRLKNLPSEIQNLDSLEELLLFGSPSITKFPEVGKNIKVLDLEATAMEEVPPSIIKHLSQLKKLNMSNCKRLKNFPCKVQNVDSLEELTLSNCPNITEFPELGKNIKVLYLNATAIEEVPPSIKHLSKLQKLYMSDCKRLKNLPSEIQNLETLEELHLCDCPNITEFPEVGKGIKFLLLDRTAIKEVPSWIWNRHLLVELSLKGCSNITKLPEIPVNLVFLFLFGMGIREVYNEATRCQVKDQVICGEYDSNGRRIALHSIDQQHPSLVLASFDHSFYEKEEGIYIFPSSNSYLEKSASVSNDLEGLLGSQFLCSSSSSLGSGGFRCVLQRRRN